MTKPKPKPPETKAPVLVIPSKPSKTAEQIEKAKKPVKAAVVQERKEATAKKPPVKAAAKTSGTAPAKPNGSRREVKAMKKAVHSSLNKSTEPANASASKLAELNSTFNTLFKQPTS